jgi:DnaK suppressor protein
MKTTASTQHQPFQELLQRKEAELDLVVHRREDIAIEKSADPMDEIQYASERDLAIRNVARDSALLREVRGALSRIRDGSYGNCADCENAIGSKRLSVLPWAALCIQCQEAADRDDQREAEFLRGNLENAAL